MFFLGVVALVLTILLMVLTHFSDDFDSSHE